MGKKLKCIDNHKTEPHHLYCFEESSVFKSDKYTKISALLLSSFKNPELL